MHKYGVPVGRIRYVPPLALSLAPPLVQVMAGAGRPCTWQGSVTAAIFTAVTAVTSSSIVGGTERHENITITWLSVPLRSYHNRSRGDVTSCRL